MGPQSSNAYEILARLGTRSKGVVTRDELLAEGLTVPQIKKRVRKGLLIPEYPGVYRVGHRAPSVEASYLAAARACGDGAVLSGKAAAWLWGLIKGRPPAPEVSAPSERRISGLRTRRRRLDPSEVTTHRGIPITTVPLTLVDLTPLLPQFELAQACHEAGIKYRTTPAQVESVLRRRPNAPGATKLRAILRGDEQVTLSRLEAKFLELLRAEDLPLPRTNKPAGGRRVDCRWPEHKLTVELDSYRFHNSRHSWEADRRRERQAYARGDEFRRFTYGDVFERPRQMMRELRQLLLPNPEAGPGSRGGPRRARGRG
jgi:very-short-patch-repair endonuclease